MNSEIGHITQFLEENSSLSSRSINGINKSTENKYKILNNLGDMFQITEPKRDLSLGCRKALEI